MKPVQMLLTLNLTYTRSLSSTTSSHSRNELFQSLVDQLGALGVPHHVSFSVFLEFVRLSVLQLLLRRSGSVGMLDWPPNGDGARGMRLFLNVNDTQMDAFLSVEDTRFLALSFATDRPGRFHFECSTMVAGICCLKTTDDLVHRHVPAPGTAKLQLSEEMQSKFQKSRILEKCTVHTTCDCGLCARGSLHTWPFVVRRLNARTWGSPNVEAEVRLCLADALSHLNAALLFGPVPGKQCAVIFSQRACGDIRPH
jgi:hypothetical protein